MQVYHVFFLVPWSISTFPDTIRIRILANDTDPTGSGSKTLLSIYLGWLLTSVTSCKCAPSGPTGCTWGSYNLYIYLSIHLSIYLGWLLISVTRCRCAPSATGSGPTVLVSWWRGTMIWDPTSFRPAPQPIITVIHLFGRLFIYLQSSYLSVYSGTPHLSDPPLSQLLQ